MKDTDVSIRTEKLGRSFGDVRAVDDVSLAVARGALYGLVGPDGAGKTSFIRMLAGVLPATAGDAWIEGHCVTKDPESAKASVGYVSQRFSLYPDLTVTENLRFYADIFGVSAHKRQPLIAELLQLSDLERASRRAAGLLSGGMKQKLSLACALVHSPSILLLDEPTCGLDPLARRELWRMLYGIAADGATIFVSTAYLDEAERCSNVGLLFQGSIVASGPPDDIKALIPGVVISIETPNPRLLARLLRDHEAVCSADVYGCSVHAVLREGRSAAELSSCLSVAGLPADSAVVISPSLEDAFVYVVRDRRAHAH